REHRVGPGLAWRERRTWLWQCHGIDPYGCAPPSWPADAQPQWSAEGPDRSRKVAPAKRHQARSGPLPGSEACESARTMQVRRIRWIQGARVSSKPVDSTKYYLPSHRSDESGAAAAYAFGTR